MALVSAMFVCKYPSVRTVQLANLVESKLAAYIAWIQKAIPCIDADVSLAFEFRFVKQCHRTSQLSSCFETDYLAMENIVSNNCYWRKVLLWIHLANIRKSPWVCDWNNIPKCLQNLECKLCLRRIGERFIGQFNCQLACNIGCVSVDSWIRYISSLLYKHAMKSVILIWVL